MRNPCSVCSLSHRITFIFLFISSVFFFSFSFVKRAMRFMRMVDTYLSASFLLLRQERCKRALKRQLKIIRTNIKYYFLAFRHFECTKTKRNIFLMVSKHLSKHFSSFHFILNKYISK